MTTTEPARASTSIEAITERLSDPGVAASLVTLLDHAELLSTLVLGLGGVIARGETIMDSVAAGLHDLRGAGRPEGVPALAEITAATRQLVDAAPTLHQVLGSSMTKPETIALLSMLSDAATEWAEAARRNHTEIKGALGALRALKDDDVQRGLGLFVEIARALGRRMGTA
jgi:uncharacterized protein YjgD (DUF1641 family)